MRWGSWIGGDRDGNPNVTAEVTRAAFERQRALVIRRHLRDAEALGRELSISHGLRGASNPELESSLEKERERWPEVAARAAKQNGSRTLAREALVRPAPAARRVATATNAAIRAPTSTAPISSSSASALRQAGLGRLAQGKLRDAIRRAEVFGFHLATLDIRQHSDVHASAVDEVLASGGRPGYRRLSEQRRVALLEGLLERADAGRAARPRRATRASTREMLATFDAVGRARRELGPEACERWIVSFTRGTSDLLEVLFLARAARLGPDEIRPMPLLEQVEDIERARRNRRRILLQLRSLRTAIGNELEVMLGYSDGGKQLGYVASSVAIRSAQQELARVANRSGATLDRVPRPRRRRRPRRRTRQPRDPRAAAQRACAGDCA